jgi:hypothetical protein
MRILLTASFPPAREDPMSAVGRPLPTPFCSRGLKIRNQAGADGCASLTNSPGGVRNRRDPTTRRGKTHFEDFSRT